MQYYDSKTGSQSWINTIGLDYQPILIHSKGSSLVANRLSEMQNNDDNYKKTTTLTYIHTKKRKNICIHCLDLYFTRNVFRTIFSVDID